MIETPPIIQIPQKSLQLLWQLLRLWLPPHLRKEDGQVPFGVWLLQIDSILCNTSMIPWGVPKGVPSFCSATWKTLGCTPKGSWPTRNCQRAWGTMMDHHGNDHATLPFRHWQSVRQNHEATWKLLVPHVEVGGSDYSVHLVVPEHLLERPHQSQWSPWAQAF